MVDFSKINWVLVSVSIFLSSYFCNSLDLNTLFEFSIVLIATMIFSRFVMYVFP